MRPRAQISQLNYVASFWYNKVIFDYICSSCWALYVESKIMSKYQILTTWQAIEISHLINVDVADEAGNLINHFCALESSNSQLNNIANFWYNKVIFDYTRSSYWALYVESKIMLECQVLTTWQAIEISHLIDVNIALYINSKITLKIFF